MSDRTERPVGDRPGRPGEHRNSEAQIRTLLDNQKEKILADCQARIDQHEFQAARAEEDQRLLQGQLLQQNLELREAHQRSLTGMEENKEVSEFYTRHLKNGMIEPHRNKKKSEARKEVEKIKKKKKRKART